MALTARAHIVPHTESQVCVPPMLINIGVEVRRSKNLGCNQQMLHQRGILLHAGDNACKRGIQPTFETQTRHH